MNITLNIQADSPVELQEAIAGLAHITVGTVQVSTKEAVKEEKPKRTTGANKQTKETAKKEEIKEEPATIEEQVEEEVVEIPSVVDLRAKAQEKGKTAEGKKAIKALLEEFESKSISAVPDEKRAAFMAALEAL